MKYLLACILMGFALGALTVSNGRTWVFIVSGVFFFSGLDIFVDEKVKNSKNK